MADNWDVAPPVERRSTDYQTAYELKGINNTLEEIKEDIKKVEKHDREILDLQYQFQAQQKTLEGLTHSVNKLTETLSTITQKFSEQLAALSLKFFTGVAWVGGGAAVITIIWALISSGILQFGVGK